MNHLFKEGFTGALVREVPLYRHWGVELIDGIFLSADNSRAAVSYDLSTGIDKPSKRGILLYDLKNNSVLARHEFAGWDSEPWDLKGLKIKGSWPWTFSEGSLKRFLLAEGPSGELALLDMRDGKLVWVFRNDSPQEKHWLGSRKTSWEMTPDETYVLSTYDSTEGYFILNTDEDRKRFIRVPAELRAGEGVLERLFGASVNAAFSPSHKFLLFKKPGWLDLVDFHAEAGAEADRRRRVSAYAVSPDDRALAVIEESSGALKLYATRKPEEALRDVVAEWLDRPENSSYYRAVLENYYLAPLRRQGWNAERVRREIIVPLQLEERAQKGNVAADEALRMLRGI